MREMYIIEVSKQRVVITDPQRRVYNGCIAKYEKVFGPFEVLESGITKEDIESRLNFWVDLNDYAVSQRGEGSRKHFKVTKEV